MQESTDVPFFDTAGKKVKHIKTIIHTGGGRVDWSAKGDLIALCKKGDDGYSDLWTMKADGSEQRCFTCDNSGIPQKHNGQPAWHPSGDYIVFQSQNPNLGGPDHFANVGKGINNNLWVTIGDGSKFWQLTDVRQGMGVLHSHFSNDGKKLTWAERIGKGEGWGDWAIMVADFVVDKNGPRLENKKMYHPGGKGAIFYETHGFSPDDEKILFSSNIGGNAVYAIDIWTLDLETEKLTQLTNTKDVWDEHAHYWPDGKKILWISSEGYPFPKSPTNNWGAWLSADYWMMNADGSDKQRLTYFNEPGAAEYIGEGGRVIVADSSFSPDGTKTIALMAIIFKDGRAASSVVLIEF
jgi:Tol biopolymer transport system component